MYTLFMVSFISFSIMYCLGSYCLLEEWTQWKIYKNSSQKGENILVN